ncbi:transposase family protein [Sporosalibacterium faouarense]|uniref:transposase family protein n=1 Tax=Sporosalibacterium faouarense TaxID=516123 RepID=UPI00311CCEE6
MDELIKLLDKNLKYINHKIEDETIYIYVKSNRDKCYCPDCNSLSKRVHSRYERSFQDLPIIGRKSIIILNNRKFFCDNKNCHKRTFSEKFDFIRDRAKRTKRLEDEIINLSQNMSSISASKLLRKNIVTIGKSTVCNILKKTKPSAK